MRSCLSDSPYVQCMNRMIIIQRFTNINLHLSVIWQASSLKSHSLYLKLIHVQQFSTSNRVVIKSQEPRGIPSATLKVTHSSFH